MNRLPQAVELPAGTPVQFVANSEQYAIGLRTGILRRHSTAEEFAREAATDWRGRGNPELLAILTDGSTRDRWPVVWVACQEFPAGIEFLVNPRCIEPTDLGPCSN